MVLVKMKGQIFIMASVMVLIALMLLQNSIRSFEQKPRYNIYDSFSNIKSEIIRTVDISFANDEDIASNMDSFIDFSKAVMSRKGYSEEVSYTVNSYANTVEVNVSLALSLQDSFIESNFIINRTVFT